MYGNVGVVQLVNDSASLKYLLDKGDYEYSLSYDVQYHFIIICGRRADQKNATEHLILIVKSFTTR